MINWSSILGLGVDICYRLVSHVGSSYTKHILGLNHWKSSLCVKTSNFWSWLSKEMNQATTAGSNPRLNRVAACSSDELFCALIFWGFLRGLSVRDCKGWCVAKFENNWDSSTMWNAWGSGTDIRTHSWNWLLMRECIYVFVYRCLKLTTCALLKCLISLHLEQVSTLTCITMDHDCWLLMCYVVFKSGM